MEPAQVAKGVEVLEAEPAPEGTKPAELALGPSSRLLEAATFSTTQELTERYKTDTFVKCRRERLAAPITQDDMDLAIEQSKFSHGNTLGLAQETVMEVLQLPPGISRDDWFSGIITILFNHTNLLVALIRDTCTAETCPLMAAGKRRNGTWKYHYKEKGDVPSGVAYDVPAIQYMHNTLVYMEQQLDDDQVCPTELEEAGDEAVTYPPAFMDFIRTSVKRMFRIYVHVYHVHYAEFESAGSDKCLNNLFKHLALFVKMWKLLPDDEVEPLKQLVQNFWGEFKDQSPDQTRNADD